MRGRLPKKIESVGNCLADTSPPDYLMLTDSEKAVWTRTVVILANNGLLTDLDVDSVADYCRDMVMAVSIRAMIREHGETITAINKHGTEYTLRNPLLVTLKEVLERLGKFRSDYGMTALSRQRIRAGAKADDSDDAFLFGGNQ